jgi:hypothetical protein
MNTSQQNRFTRLKKVRAMLDRFQAEWQNEPALVKAIGQLDNEITFIEIASSLTGGGTKHITSSKNAQWETLIEKLVWLSGILYSLADDQKDEELKSICNLTNYEYQSLSTPAFIRAFRQLVGRATDLDSDVMDEYGLDADILESYQIMAENLDSILGITQLSVTELKVVRKEISTRLARVRTLLTRKVRKLLVPFKSKNTNLYQAFESAMTIVDRRSRLSTKQVDVEVE